MMRLYIYARQLPWDVPGVPPRGSGGANTSQNWREKPSGGGGGTFGDWFSSTEETESNNALIIMVEDDDGEPLEELTWFEELCLFASSGDPVWIKALHKAQAEEQAKSMALQKEQAARLSLWRHTVV